MPTRAAFSSSSSRGLNHVDLVLRLSLLVNVFIVLSMMTVALATQSLALLSSLVENLIDLLVQGLLWYAASCVGRHQSQDFAQFPAGTSRFEPVAVIVASSVMGLVAVLIIQESVKRLVQGFDSSQTRVEPSLSVAAVAISCGSIVVKLMLVQYAQWVLGRCGFSSAVDAIRQDNRNDVVSNTFALLAYITAAFDASLWFLDASGAMVIFGAILLSWIKTARVQVMHLVGVTASKEFIAQLRDLCTKHHPLMQLDILRAYHFGSRYLVELEVVLPSQMPVVDAHEIAIQLQFKVEQLDQVERCFVHVDYQTRSYDEHVVSRERDALHTYTRLRVGSVFSSRRKEDATSVGSTSAKHLEWSGGLQSTRGFDGGSTGTNNRLDHGNEGHDEEDPETISQMESGLGSLSLSGSIMAA